MLSRLHTLGAIAIAGAALALATPSAYAQASGSISGSVVEAETMRPMSGVQIAVVGTGRGGLTNARGEFVILNVPAGQQTIQVSMIGYETVERVVDVPAGGTVPLQLELGQQAISLDAVVVTGTAGAVSKRTLGNSVTQLDAAEITERVSNTNLTELLQGKAPGVTLMPGGGTLGTGGSLRIRGAGSLSAGNQPVIYVDGVRMHTADAGAFRASSYGDGQKVMAFNQINPADIERIEIIKGPAAATLYGAEAAGGVIQIITKKGKPGQQELEWNASVTTGQTDWAVDELRNYTTCTQERIDDPATWPGCSGLSAGTIINYAGLKDHPDALRTGGIMKYAMSVRGGGDGYSFYIAGDRDEEEGVYYNNWSDRTSARANFAFYPAEGLDFGVNFGYTKTHIALPLNDNSGGSMILSTSLASPGRDYSNGKPLGWLTTDPAEYYLYDNQLRGDRVTVGGTLNYQPLPWLRNRLTVGLDYDSRLAEKYVPAGHPVFGPWFVDGYAGQATPQTEIYTAHYTGTASHAFSEELESELSFGAQYEFLRNRNTISEGYGFGSELNRMVSQAAVTEGTESYSEQSSLGLFVQEQVGWRHRLFVTGAVRMDNNSAFGADIQQTFYPKAMVSWVISEEPFFDLPYLDQLKLRAAWGQAGNAPDPFAAARSYVASVTTLQDGSTVPGLRLGAYGNPDLKPERGEELEVGFDASLFDNRLGLDVTYYSKRMRDALMSVPVPPSSGFSGSRYENLGETLNRGFEVSVTGTPVQRAAVTWDTRLSLTTNHNELVSFGYERDPILFGIYAFVQRFQEGYPLGGYWATGPQRNPDGTLVLNEAGGIVPDTARYVGPATPTREIAFSNTVTLFRNLQLYALLDHKGGHYLWNVKSLRRCWERRSNCWEVNDPDTDPDRRFLLLNADLRNNNVDFIQPADFVKLRDLSLTYTLPDAWSGRFGSDRVSLTLAGHDLWVWAPDYMGPDPEVNFSGPDDFVRVDAWTAPMLRRITASVNVSF